MKPCSIFALVCASFVVVFILSTVNAKRKNENSDVDYDSSRSMKSRNGKHEYNKYSREFSDESAQHSRDKQKAKKGNNKRLQLDLDNVNEDELSSDERQVLEYRRKKLERQSKKTLSDVFQEKKQKNKQRKEKFEKHVLKHFKRGDEDNDNGISSEEVITPLKRVKLSQTDPDECDSSEEKCT